MDSENTWLGELLIDYSSPVAPSPIIKALSLRPLIKPLSLSLILSLRLLMFQKILSVADTEAVT